MGILADSGMTAGSPLVPWVEPLGNLTDLNLERPGMQTEQDSGPRDKPIDSYWVEPQDRLVD